VIPILTDSNVVSEIINEVLEIIKMKVEARMRMESLLKTQYSSALFS
jgi:uncharacterized protein YqgV (UPF0045/DUF77 family)